MATIRPLKLPGAPDQELMEQGASRHSRLRAFGASRASGALLIRSQWDHYEDHRSLGPLEQARAPDQEPVEPHGASRGSRSKDTGPLELGALNQESMGLHQIPYSGPQLGFYTAIPAGVSYNKSRTAPQALGLS